MKTFYVNLARRPERRAFMERQFEALGLDVERVEGVDGRAMPEAAREKAVSRFRWWCANGYRARAGEIGCALSHQSIYRRMVDEGISCACILEDDVTLDSRFLEMLTACEGFLAGQGPATVLILAPYKGRAGRAAATPRFDKVLSAALAGGYVLDKEAAWRLLAVNSPLHTTIDNWGRLCRLGGIGLYDASPVVCQQPEYASMPDNPAFASDTIDPGTVFVADMPPFRKLLHKALRCVGVSFDFAFGQLIDTKKHFQVAK